MPTPSIIERVREVHSELAETQPSGPGELGDLRKQLDTVLLEPDKADRYAALRDRLQAAYADFENDYPKLAGAVQGLIAELTAAGL